jgi:hypothetical protein
MEDVLDLYDQPYDPKHPVICYDERPCQLIDDVITPIPMKPGKPQKRDYEYRRNGTFSILIAFEPLTGKRIVQVSKHHRKADYALFMKRLALMYPEAETIQLVQDNLNTHTPGSFYSIFPPQDAFQLARKFECHFTPIKGSWLNMVEIELSALSRQCLDRRIGDMVKLASEVSAWEQERNRTKATVQWQFTKENARNKFHRHYLNIQN